MTKHPTSRKDPSSWGASWCRSVPAALALCFGCTITVVLAILVHGWEAEQQRIEFKRRIDKVGAAVHQRVDDNLAVLYAIRAFYAASEAVERAEFWTFAQDIRRRYSEIQALLWVPRVLAGERLAFEAAAQADGHPHFQITAPHPDGRAYPAPSRRIPDLQEPPTRCA